MNYLTVVFIGMLALSSAVRSWLIGRHIRYVSEHKNSVPEAFLDSIGSEAHRKAADYTVAKSRLNLAGLILDLTLALLWTIGGGLKLLDSTWRAAGANQMNTGVIVICCYALINALIALPLNIYSTFGIESSFGFNRIRVKTYLLDMAKLLLLAAILGIPLLYAALWLMGYSKHLWWLYVWLLWLGFSLLLTWAYPVLIAPWFNKFTPLADPALKQRIESLLQRCGFSSRGVFVMDGSTRSAHGNAYFTGFGNNKRIVFFDTLMDKLIPEEIEAVLAHELGHFRMKHVIQRLVVAAILSLAGLGILAWLSAHSWFYQGLGVPQASSYMALLLFSLLAPPFLSLIEPLSSAWSRRHEFQADAYASRYANATDLVHALVKLYRDNATTLTPDPLHSAYHDSHPPAVTRIAHLRQLARTTGH
ncbi:MAG: M48 family metallopeptidase [Gammaproteobacteria bacterium]|nr:M48 family metallopeptidase [Gammaproteobacteria bacterium]MDE2344832.1 M48 family metallopeptidase [Gammaproteobacteria bacterium]